MAILINKSFSGEIANIQDVELQTLLMLAYDANKQNMVCPNISAMCEQIGEEPHTVWNAIGALEYLELIEDCGDSGYYKLSTRFFVCGAQE